MNFEASHILHVERMFQLDILVNNAGRSQRAQWENIEINVDKDMFELDVYPVLSLSRMAVKHFLQTGKGHIVVTSSIAGIIPIPLSASYCGAKHALHVNIPQSRKRTPHSPALNAIISHYRISPAIVLT